MVQRGTDHIKPIITISESPTHKVIFYCNMLLSKSWLMRLHDNQMITLSVFSDHFTKIATLVEVAMDKRFSL
jgi:hypothetical protein